MVSIALVSSPLIALILVPPEDFTGPWIISVGWWINGPGVGFAALLSNSFMLLQDYTKTVTVPFHFYGTLVDRTGSTALLSKKLTPVSAWFPVLSGTPFDTVTSIGASPLSQSFIKCAALT